jgi:Ni,Fe-hydrogenase III small subunit
VDAGSDGSEEWEIQALLGPVYDIGRLGVFFTASPRHADVMLVTGGIAAMVPVDVWLPGSPPSPFGILNALLIAVGKLGNGGKGTP